MIWDCRRIERSALSLVIDSGETRPGSLPRSRMAREKSHRGDSNPQPAVYKTAALPLSYSGVAESLDRQSEPFNRTEGFLPPDIGGWCSAL